jgi:hypothetical protein
MLPPRASWPRSWPSAPGAADAPAVKGPRGANGGGEVVYVTGQCSACAGSGLACLCQFSFAMPVFFRNASWKATAAKLAAHAVTGLNSCLALPAG